MVMRKEKNEVVTIEKCICGSFFKYINNTGDILLKGNPQVVVKKTRYFIHFIYVTYQFMVLDTEGTKTLSDESKQFLFCSGNFSTNTIERFLISHSCKFCVMIGISTEEKAPKDNVTKALYNLLSKSVSCFVAFILFYISGIEYLLHLTQFKQGVNFSNPPPLSFDFFVKISFLVNRLHYRFFDFRLSSIKEVLIKFDYCCDFISVLLTTVLIF